MRFCFLLFYLLALALEASAQLPNYLPVNGLVAWYPFTGNANDSSGNGYHGTVLGPTLTTDRFGNANSAYNFDGNTNYISGSCSGYPTAERTVSLWFYANDIGVGISGRAFIGYGGGNCGTSWIENVD